MNKQNKNLIIVNQAVNYLTIGIANAFQKEFDNVVLLTGSIHLQGEALNSKIEAHRINRWIESPAYKKLFSYIRSLFSIYFLILFKYRKHEVFFISLPPMAYLLNLILPNKSSMLIWDVYPDIFKITGMKTSHPIYKIWAALNKKSFKKAHKLFTIGDKMATLLEQYIKRDKITIQPIWSIFQEPLNIDHSENKFIEQYQLQGKFIVEYSGNIGLTHKAELMIDMAERLKHKTNILFLIIGRGPRVPFIHKQVSNKQLNNCMFLPFQSDEMFPHSISAAHVGVVILDELVSRGSVPSKAYNLMSLGIPSLYIAGKNSELNNYANKYGHAKCFTEKELDEATDFIETLASDSKIAKQYAAKAIAASQNFKRVNATKLVHYYLSKNK